MFRFLAFFTNKQTNKQTNKKHRYNWTIPLVWAQIQADADYANRKAAVATFNTANRWKKKVGRVQHRALQHPLVTLSLLSPSLRPLCHVFTALSTAVLCPHAHRFLHPLSAAGHRALPRQVRHADESVPVWSTRVRLR